MAQSRRIEQRAWFAAAADFREVANVVDHDVASAKRVEALHHQSGHLCISLANTDLSHHTP